MQHQTRFVIYISVAVTILSFVSGRPIFGFVSLITGAMIVAYIGSRREEERSIPDHPPSLTVRGFTEGSRDPVHNPYGNPMPYEPGIAVRSSKPPMRSIRDNCLSTMFRGTDEWDQNLFFNQIPDPTLVARPVYWTQDPHPDIVSNEAACADRLCR